MERTVAQSELSTRDAAIEFRTATDADDADIRDLLRRTVMPGEISISFQREPDSSMARRVEGAIHEMIIARDRRNGQLVAMGSLAVRDAWINGALRPLGYLSLLRVDQRYRRRVSILLRGYEMLREIQARLLAELYLTSVIADNRPALRFLEAGVRDMPTYRHVGDFVTTVMRVRGRAAIPPGIRQATPADVPAIADLLQREGRRFQFRPHWTANDLRSPHLARGLQAEDFLIASSGHELVGCMAVWDQREFKQTVVRGYSRRLARWRAAINLAAWFGVGLRLPEPGETLALAYLSHVANAPDRPDVFHGLLQASRAIASRRGIELIATGFARNDVRLKWLPPPMSSWRYVSRLYLVFCDEGRAAADALDQRVPSPEVALL